MSHGGDLFDLDHGNSMESAFDVVLRGYPKGQVDKALARVDAIVAAITAERDEAYGQIQALAAQVHEVQMQLAGLRRKTAADAMVSFRHLGPRVEQILTLAEEQAEAIRASAIQDIAAQRTEAERVLTEARAQSHQATRDFEIALAARRHEEEQATAQRRAAVQGEIAQAQEYAGRLRREAESMVQ